MLPFIGYHAGDYFQHWLDIGKTHQNQLDAATLPLVFYVNWFRRDDAGEFLWPGYGENSRVLKWIVERVEGKAAAVETPIGYVPAEGALDVDGLEITAEQVAKALAVDPEEWKAELPLIEEWFAKIGDKTPSTLLTELDGLKARLGIS
jgi:phosphoenolpyruvate carboxykinase (GTP)